MNTVEWTKKHDLIDWIVEHTQNYYLVIGTDGYVTDNEFDAYFQTKWLPSFINKTVLISMILISVYDAEVFYHSYTNNKKDKYYKYNGKDIRKLGPNKIDEIIRYVMNTGNGVIDILFTDTLDCQYLMAIGAHMNVNFFNMTVEQRKYVEALVNKEGLSLKLDDSSDDLEVD